MDQKLYPATVEDCDDDSSSESSFTLPIWLRSPPAGSNFGQSVTPPSEISEPKNDSGNDVSYPKLNLDPLDQSFQEDTPRITIQEATPQQTISDFQTAPKVDFDQYPIAFPPMDSPLVHRLKRLRTNSDAVAIEGFTHSENSNPKPRRTRNISPSQRLADRLIRQKDFPVSLPNNLTPEEEAQITSSLQLPPNSHIQWYNATTKVLCVLVDTSYIPDSDPLIPLYQDVIGKPPKNQSFVTDMPMDENLFPRSTIDQELARAEALSQRSVANAPRYDTNLPEDLMKDITLEEAIVYFPNHVLRWPGLALALRMMCWDQTFCRIAYLINMARDSLHLDRDYRHAEPLPCMLKMEKAIQEFEPSYKLADHDGRWHVQIDHEWLQASLFQKPRVFPEHARTVTLEEVGSYVSIPVEFQNLAFTQRVNKACVQVREARITNPIVRDIFGIGRKGSDVSMTDVSGLGNWADDDEDPGPKKAKACRAGDKCSRVNCKFGHTDEWRAKQAQLIPDRASGQAPQQSQTANQSDADDWDVLDIPTPTPSSGRECPLGAGCINKHTICPHNHLSVPEPDKTHTPQPNHRDTEPNTPPQKKPAKPCTYDKKCTRADCTFAHTSPAAPDDTELDLTRWCKFNPCTNTNCTSCHSSPGKSSGGNPNLNGHGNRGGSGRGQGEHRGSREDHAGAGRGQGGDRRARGHHSGDHGNGRGGQGRGEGGAPRGRGGGHHDGGNGARSRDHGNGQGGGQNGGAQYRPQRRDNQHGANKHHKPSPGTGNYRGGNNHGGGRGGGSGQLRQ